MISLRSLLAAGLCAAPLTTGWAQEEPSTVPPYEGPTLAFEALETLYSEQGVVKYKMRTPRAQHYENGDRVYPEGAEIVLYDDDDQSVSATARANQVYYVADGDVYEFRGDVELVSLRNKAQLNTEAMYWQPGDEKVYTEKFIRVETESKLLTGEGLTAKQDLSQYSIEHPQGVFNVKSIKQNAKH